MNSIEYCRVMYYSPNFDPVLIQFELVELDILKTYKEHIYGNFKQG